MVETRWALLAALTLVLAGCAGNGTETGTENPEATIQTNLGNITILLYGNLTPQTVQNFGNLAQDGYFEDTEFHRVIRGFMAQGGDPATRNGTSPEGWDENWGAGGPGYKIVDEFACNDGTVSNEFTGYRSQKEPCDGHDGLALKHDKAGMVSMANSGKPKTGGSQFFITFRETPNLDGTHPVFAEVVDGMDVLREIENVTTRCTQEGEQPNSRTCQQNRWNYPVDPVVTVESVTIEGELPGVQVEKFKQS